MWALVMFLLADDGSSDVLTFKVNRALVFDDHTTCETYYNENYPRLFQEALSVRGAPFFKFDCIDATKDTEVGPHLDIYSI